MELHHVLLRPVGVLCLHHWQNLFRISKDSAAGMENTTYLYLFRIKFTATPDFLSYKDRQYEVVFQFGGFAESLKGGTEGK